MAEAEFRARFKFSWRRKKNASFVFDFADAKWSLLIGKARVFRFWKVHRSRGMVFTRLKYWKKAGISERENLTT